MEQFGPTRYLIAAGYVRYDLVMEASPKSYRDTMMGVPDENKTEAPPESDPNKISDEGDYDAEDRWTVEEKEWGEYKYPVISLSEREEARIQRKWKQGLMVKLLGQKIGFKALENRLNQLWVRKGVINIIDLGNEFFLVTFTNDEDRTHALTDGPRVDL